MKICTQCKQEKPYTEFHRTGSNTRAIGKVRAQCKLCTNYNNQQRYPFYHTKNKDLISQRRKKRHFMVRRHTLKKLYGISEEIYNKLSEAQQNVCAICRQPETKLRFGTLCKLSVDHDHETGSVRGLLCLNCNIGLGNFKENPTFLQAAATYIGSSPLC